MQVGLFNIMQEGDVQIKGYPRPPAARRAAGLHGQPGRLHGPRQDHHASERSHRQRDSNRITRLPSPARNRHHETGGVDAPAVSGCRPKCHPIFTRWWSRSPFSPAKTSALTSVPGSRSGYPSRCWKTLFRTPSAGALKAKDPEAVPRILDLYAALPSMTGKLELEYEEN